MAVSQKHKGFRWTVGDESNPTLALLVDNTSRALHIAEAVDAGTDWNVAADTHPSVYIHSATTPATDYIKMWHDATDAYFNAAAATTLYFQIAGTTEMELAATALTLSAPLTVGVDDTGYDVKFFGATASAYMEWDESADRLNIVTVSGRTMSGEEHALDITMGGTMNSSDDAMVGLNVAVTPSGTLGTWAAGIFAKVTQTVASVDGYICGAEFEVNKSGSITNRNYGVIVLNNGNNIAGAQSSSAFILCREYGSNVLNALVKFGDNASYSATSSATALVCATTDIAANRTVRFVTTVSGVATSMWLLATTTAPSGV